MYRMHHHIVFICNSYYSDQGIKISLPASEDFQPLLSSLHQIVKSNPKG